jgi:fucose permease
MLGCIFALILAILFEHFKWNALLWICTVIYGACMASIFATAFTIPVELRLKGSSKASSAFIVASGVGDMALPVIAGKAITYLGPTALLWLSLGVFCFCLAVYMVLFTYGLSTMEKKLNELELREIESLNDYWN